MVVIIESSIFCYSFHGPTLLSVSFIRDILRPKVSISYDLLGKLWVIAIKCMPINAFIYLIYIVLNNSMLFIIYQWKNDVIYQWKNDNS